MSRLLILGAGGHGKVVADIANILEQWDSISFLDDRKELKEVIGFPVIGKLMDYKTLKNDFKYAFVAIGNSTLRLNWLERLHKEGFIIPTIIHPQRIVTKFIGIEYGTVIMAGVVVNAGTSIGRGCILNTSCSIDHDCKLGDGVHISPGAHIGGTAIIGSRAWLGIGSSIVNNIIIGNNSIVAAGATVIKNVPENVTVAGVPAEIIKTKNK